MSVPQDMGTADFVAAGLTAALGEFARRQLVASAAKARARRSSGAIVYRVTVAGRVVFAAATLIFAGLIAAVLLQGDDWRITLILAPFLLLCVFGLPGPIRVDAEGVSTRRWYTRRTRILWREVIDVRGPDQAGQVFVIGANGHTIVHTGLHVGVVGFHREVMRFARVSPSRIEPA